MDVEEPPRMLTDAKINELLEFIRRFGVLLHDEALLRHLITHIPASPAHVLDLAAKDGRSLVASVLDTVSNATDSALLAVLGARPSRGLAVVLGRAIDRAEELTRAGPRRRLEVPLPGGPLGEMSTVLAERGYSLAFSEYRMTRDGLEGLGAPKPIPAGWRWRHCERTDLPAYFALSHAAFRGVPGTHSPEFETFSEMFDDTRTHTRLLEAPDGLAGFANVSVVADGVTGTIGSIGRRPDLRGRGLGEAILDEALRTLMALGAQRATMEVVADNECALSLSERSGFEVVERDETWARELR